MTIKKWLKLNTKDLTGKTIVITGSTGGLGQKICEILLDLNANLICLNRNKEKSKTQKTQLLKKHPSAKINIIQADMEDIKSVENAYKILSKSTIDILILNAGAFHLKRNTTSLGYDNIFQVNFLSPYYLTKQLLPQLRQNEDSKVVMVSSIAHRYSKLNEADLQLLNEKKHQKIYGNSKRLLMFSLFELFKNEHKVKLSVAHPGITQTNITSNYPKIFQPFIKLGMKLLYSSPKKASLSIIKSIFENTQYQTWIGPAHKDIWGFPEKKKLQSCSKDESKKIFEISEKIYKKIKK